MHERTLVRCCSQLLLTAGIVLLSVQSAAAQSTPTRLSPPVEIPESVVLVLKLVSATYVKPTTGVVISSDGLVLVPANFVAAGDEIVVMDGGTDIIRNGRPSKTVKRSVADGLAVLSVKGLARPGIILAQDNKLQERVLHMAAFPPAEKLAQGAQPLWVPVKLTKSDANGGLSVSADTPLPNTTGAIIDECGFLVGLNLAADGQSLDRDETPVAIFGDALTRIFDAMQINLQRGVCQQSSQEKSAQPIGQAQPGPREGKDLAAKIPSPRDQAAQSNDAGLGSATDAMPPEEALPATSNQDAPAVPAPVVADNDSSSVLSIAPMWLWKTGVVILILLLVRVVFFSGRTKFLGLTKHDPQPAAGEQAAVDGPSSSAEPDTAPLAAGADSADRNTGLKPSDEEEIPDVNALPEGFDGILVIEGSLGDNTGFRRYCVVDTQHIDVVIGRGGTDIGIATPAISRRHVRLENVGESMTISDLGSSNGTFIRGIPCLPAETMFIDPEDEVLLGDVRFRIRVLTRRGEPK